jgi:hypothetical protein
VDGYLDWSELQAHGPVDISGARISGSANFNDVSIHGVLSDTPMAPGV